jgi:hypothetical protein
MGDYPANTLAGTGWDSIAYPSGHRLAVKIRADWRCEHCLHPHDVGSGHVLTVHHYPGGHRLDGDPGNCVPENLVAFPQRGLGANAAIPRRGPMGCISKPVTIRCR